MLPCGEPGQASVGGAKGQEYCRVYAGKRISYHPINCHHFWLRFLCFAGFFSRSLVMHQTVGVLRVGS